MLALVRCLTHWRWLLDGTTDLTIYTDSKALVTAKLFEESQPAWASYRCMRARWSSGLRVPSATNTLLSPGSAKTVTQLQRDAIVFQNEPTHLSRLVNCAFSLSRAIDKPA